MVEIDGNGRDGGGRREDIPLTYSPSFHFFYFSLSPSFFLASFFSFLFFFVCFCNYFFKRYFKIKEFTKNKDMEELFRGLKRVCQNVKCNVLKGYVHVRGMWRRCNGCVSHLGV